MKQVQPVLTTHVMMKTFSYSAHLYYRKHIKKCNSTSRKAIRLRSVHWAACLYRGLPLLSVTLDEQLPLAVPAF